MKIILTNQEAFDIIQSVERKSLENRKQGVKTMATKKVSLIVAQLQIKEGLTVRKVGKSLKVVAVVERKKKMQFEIREEEGRKGIEYACYRNGKPCITGLCKPVVFKSRKSAENYISKQVEIWRKDALISNEERAAMRKEREEKEAAEKAARDAAFDERLRREREQKEARRQRALLNGALRAKGYKWMNVGFKSEEDADAFDVNLPIGNYWQLFDANGNAISLSAAKTAIGW